MVRVAAVVLTGVAASGLLAGCAHSELRGGRGPTEPGFEPALTRLFVDEDGLSVALALTHAGPGVASYVLGRNGQTVASGGLDYSVESRRGDWVGRVGKGLSVSGHRVRNLTGPDIAIALSPGHYVLQVNVALKGRSAPVTSVEAFDVVLTDTTQGRLPSLANTRSASLTFGREALPWKFEALDGVPETALWLGLEAPVGQTATRVDVALTLDGASVGSGGAEVDVTGDLEREPLVVPVLAWLWPASVPFEAVLGRPGRWEVHVVQDGRALMTCAFDVADGAVLDAEVAGLKLPCGAPKPAAVTLARERADRAHRPDPARAQEALALSRSAELRKLKQEIARLRVDSTAKTAAAIRAKEEESRAMTHADAQKARERHLVADSLRASLERDVTNLERRYRALVASVR